MDIKQSGILRLNNLGRKYGVTPIFRTFKPISTLETFEATDKINARSKGKKMIFQKLRKELINADGEDCSYESMAYSHDSLLKAWRNQIVIFTAPAAVEEISYVEPKVEFIDINSIYYYRGKVFTNLGINFLSNDNKNNFTTATISLKELMKMINKITEQLEEVLKKWYKVVLEDNNIPIEYCPDISVIDSEMLEMDIKLEVATFLYSMLNCSYETAYGALGYDSKSEALKREEENKKGLETVFLPRLTAYTNNGDSNDTPTEDSKSGRPLGKSKNEDKTKQDQNRRGTT